MRTIISDFWRLAVRYRLYTALNVIGLGLGVATFLTLALVARYELGWDGFYRQSASIYELQADFMIGSGTFHMAALHDPVLPAVQTRMPGLQGTRLEQISADLVAPSDISRTVHYDQTVSFVDPNFFDLFDLKFTAGSPAVLSSPENIILSATMARQLFGTKPALGQTLEVTRHGKTSVYRVAGVLRDHPSNTMIPTDLIAAIPKTAADRPCDGWDTMCAQTYAVLPTAALRRSFLQNAHDVLMASPMSRALKQTDPGGEKMTFKAVPLPLVHFGSDGVAEDGASRSVLFALAAIGTLSLLAGAMNYVNLATAQSLGRAREVAIRKVLGASHTRLMIRFLGETLVLTTLATMLGLILTEIALPMVASLSGWAVTLDYGWALPLLGGVIVVLTLGAGFYPAFMLSSFSPAPVLASARLPAQGRFGARIRLFLVGLQFAFAVTLGICTLVVNAQALHLRHLDRGMTIPGLAIIATENLNVLDRQQTAIVNLLRAMPDVTDLSVSAGGALGRYDVGGVHRTPGQKAFMAQTVAHDEAFFRTFRLRLLAGRLTTSARATDVTHTKNGAPDVLAQNFVLSREATRKLGFSSPQAALGQTFMFGDNQAAEKRTIVGVVEDVILNSGQDTLPPPIYELETGPIEQGIIAFRTAPGAMPRVLSTLRRAWPTLAPGVPFEPQTMTEIIADSTRGDIARGRLFSIGAAVAIAIACLGLYGLAAFNAERRMHEVGIRKTLGATTAQIMRLLLGQFLRPVLYASLIAWPVAWLFMRNWLTGFDNPVALTPLYFVLTTLLAALLCALTIFGRTFGLARAEPARALRAE
ncbi:ABC transporter permease [Gluconobacter sp. Dm-44]|uniref:ABC transporter permease n=1 Tax=Gluconobacter sp. Dm-44 TaxID=2799805 RepID=UPI001B8D2F62|nr:ABC transporter permease [Gluconobacter sp. Dm-44]MBS1060007.1 ABC transporter permease [Gluconobacter sp. Dm-44]